jgi:hypothetical protein
MNNLYDLCEILNLKPSIHFGFCCFTKKGNNIKIHFFATNTCDGFGTTCVLAITFNNIMLDFSLNVKGLVEVNFSICIHWHFIIGKDGKEMCRCWDSNIYIVMSLKQCCLHKDLQI